MKRALTVLLTVPALLLGLTFSPAIGSIPPPEESADSVDDAVVTPAATPTVFEAADSDLPAVVECCATVRSTFRAGLTLSRAFFKAAAVVVASLIRTTVHAVT